jgi:hypothetical protein
VVGRAARLDDPDELGRVHAARVLVDEVPERALASARSSGWSPKRTITSRGERYTCSTGTVVETISSSSGPALSITYVSPSRTYAATSGSSSYGSPSSSSVPWPETRRGARRGPRAARGSDRPARSA